MGQHFDGDMDMDTISSVSRFAIAVCESTLRFGRKKPAIFTMMEFNLSTWTQRTTQQEFKPVVYICMGHYIS